MSLKAELETWMSALEAYDAQDYQAALGIFSTIAVSSKILFNMGLIRATIGEQTAAVELFNAATGLDMYLAIAHFQAGVSNYLLQRFDYALRDFEEALLYLRSNRDINYEQIGLKFRLHAAEVHFNIGLSQLAMGNRKNGLASLTDAMRAKAVEEHAVIDECLRQEGRGFTVFSIPVGVIFRPPDAKLKNIKQKDYMGKARLIAASDERDAFTTFTGVTRLKFGQGPSGSPLDGDRAAALRSEGLVVRSSSDPGLPPKSPIRQAMRGESRRGANAGEGSGVRAAAAVARSKSSAAGVSRSPASSQRGVVPALAQAQEGKERGRETEGEARVCDLDTGRIGLLDRKQSGRVTELYDGYSKLPLLAPTLPALTTVQAWAASARDAPPPDASDTSISRSPLGSTPVVRTPASLSPVASPQPPKSFRGQAPLRRAPSVRGVAAHHVRTGSVQRALQRSGSAPSASGGRSLVLGSSRGGYDEDGDAEELLLDAYGGMTDGMSFEMTKVRVKIHYESDIRALSLTPATTHADFVDRLATKFGLRGAWAGGLRVQFRDEDGSLVSLVDEDDYEAAVDVARTHADGRPEGRLEVWISVVD